MTERAPVPEERQGRSLATNAIILLLGVFLVAGLLALGVWQLERRVWKLALIDQVNRRVHAPAVAPPPPTDWRGVTAAANAYEHVRVTGVYANNRETLVEAVTDLGSGYWVLTPLRTDAGFDVLVNRGFVSPDHRAPDTRAAGVIQGRVTVTGLLRVTEPKGGFLRANDPGAGRWYSRDVKAIAAARGLTNVAPYFIDADAAPNPGGWPVGGLTVIRFPNSHLDYAITWYTLALLVVGGMVFLIRDTLRSRGLDARGDRPKPPA